MHSRRPCPSAWFLPRYGILLLMCLLPWLASADEYLTPPTVPVPTTYFGMHFHRAGDPTRVPKEGVGAWRLWDARVAWRYLADHGPVLDFRQLDRLVSLARDRRIELLYTFGATPGWASARPEEKGPYGPGSAAEPRDPAQWQGFVKRIATRYKGAIRTYEIWNEPNGGFFTGALDELVNLTCSTATLLKSIDPTITVVSPSGVGGYPQQLAWLDQFLAHGGGRCVDVIGYHIYAAKGTPESMLATLRNVQALIAKHHLDSKPLWNTETGWRLYQGPSKAAAIDPSWPKLDAQRSPAYVARALLIGWAAGLSRYYWYAWDHDDMGFLTADGRETDSATAYLGMSRWMRGAVVRDCSSVGALWQCRLARDGTDNFVLWSEDDETREVPVPSGATHLETLGGARSELVVGGRVTVGPQPILLTP
ncbi:MAG: hypothetical protein K2Y51_01260 [Gammaproteobacteria bacterium]|nr:hypothetical protein [Gammaproteobacteria bacterium]